MKYLYLFFFLFSSQQFLFGQIQPANWQSDISLLGYSGSAIIPSAYLGADRTLNIGFTHLPVEQAFQPYGTDINKDARLLFANFSFLPFMEITFGINKPYNVKDKGLGDRTIITRFQLLKERKHLPAVLVGLHDTFTKSSFVNTNYLVLSKTFSPNKGWAIISHLGYGIKIIDAKDHTLLGIFGGATLHWKFLGVSIEYDADRINTSVKLNIKDRVYLKATLLDNKYLTISTNVRFLIGKNHE